jgi:hypothetical protein
MATRLLKAVPIRFDGEVIEDFQLFTVGAIDVLPQINGTGGCILFVGTPLPRIPV